MSQTDIYDFLKANEGIKFSAREIAKHLDLAAGSCFNNLKRLLKHKDINYDKEKYWVEL